MAQYGQAVNTASVAAGQAVSSAISGQDAVGAAVGAVNPIGGYIQAGAAALTALNGLAQNGPTGAPNVSTPNFNNAPTAIVNFGSGGVNSSANPTNTQSATTPGNSGSALSGLFGGIGSTFQYLLLGLGALIVIKQIKKA